MCKNPPQYISKISVLVLIGMAMVLSGCQLQMLPPSGGTGETMAVAQTVATEEPSEESKELEVVVKAVEEPTEEAIEEPTEIPATSTAIMPTATSVPPTATSAPPTATSVPPTATSVPPTATLVPPTATLVPPTPTQSIPVVSVTISSLRIRSGPGVNYDIQGAASQGATFVIIGQAYNCQWYQIQHPEFGTAWLSGGAEYVTLSNATCAQIPAATIPSAPVAPPTAVPPPVAPPTAVPVAPPTAVPPAPVAPAPTAIPVVPPTVAPAPVAPAPTAPPQPEPNLPTDQGCYLLQNQLGAELTVTFTSSGGQAVGTFRVQKNEEVPFCLYPDKYSVTIDAPPPWGTLNDILNVKAGDSFYFPIRAGN